MARTAAARPSPAHEPGLVVHRSPLQERLEALKKEHERLLRDIAKRKVARDAAEAAARDAAAELDARLRPLREEFHATVSEIRAIFAALTGPGSRLGRRDRGRVRRLFLQLFPDLELDARTERPSDARDAEFDPFEGMPRGEAPHSSSEDRAEAGYSAHKPGVKDGLLRSLFRRLAMALHPDRVQDAKERETLTSVMKEVTRAYEASDVARLVEIERTWLASGPVVEQEDDLERRIAELLQSNKELRRQLRGLTAEVKEIKDSVPGMSRSGRRGAPRPAPSAEVQMLVDSMERDLLQIKAVRDFAQSFLDGEIDLTEFLLGPPSAYVEDPFADLLQEMLEAIADAPAPGRRPGRHRKRQQR